MYFYSQLNGWLFSQSHRCRTLVSYRACQLTHEKYTASRSSVSLHLALTLTKPHCYFSSTLRNMLNASSEHLACFLKEQPSCISIYVWKMSPSTCIMDWDLKEQGHKCNVHWKDRFTRAHWLIQHNHTQCEVCLSCSEETR